MKKNKFKTIFISVILVILAVSGYSIFNTIYSSSKSIKKIKTIDSISQYDYTLNDKSTKYYKQLFKELKEVLSNKPINDEEYAKSISKLFIADLYTLSNKLTSSDIGGVQYIYEPYKNDFISIAQDSLYSSVKSDIYGDRKQVLPEVSNVEVKSIKKKPFKLNDKTIDEAYSIDLKISYKKDLGYKENVNLALVKNDNKIEVVKLSNN